MLVRFLGWFEDINIVYLAMEYFPYGDLEKNAANIDETGVREITLDLLEGLRIIHAEGFVHRDLKPQVLVLPNNVVDAVFLTILPRTYSSQGGLAGSRDGG